MRKCRYKSLLAEIHADSDDEIVLVIPCQRFGYIDDADRASWARFCQVAEIEPKVVEQFSCPGSHRSLPVVAAGQLGQEDEEAASLQELRLYSIGRRPGSLNLFKR